MTAVESTSTRTGIRGRAGADLESRGDGVSAAFVAEPEAKRVRDR
jgi:hypothetical protein